MGEIATPILPILGEADPVIDSAFTADAFDRLASPDNSRAAFAGALHGLEHAAALDAVAAWLDARLPLA